MPAKSHTTPPANPRDRARLDAIATDPSLFRACLTIPVASGPPAPLVDVIAPFQQERFVAIDSALLAVANKTRPPIGRYWWEATKGASKDSDLAVCLLWLIAFSRRQLRCIVCAADQAQSDELRKAAKGILKENGWLQKLVQIQNWTILNPATESTVEIVPADTTGSHGSRPDVVVLNELSCCVGKREFVETMLDNAAKVPNGLVVVATNAGVLDDWTWQYREEARKSAEGESPRWSFHQFAEPAPWIDRAVLEERRRTTPPRRYARLWEGVWSDGEGDEALPRDIVLAAINQPGPMTGTESGWCFVGGIDAGVRHDHTGFVVLGVNVGTTTQVPRKVERPARDRVWDVIADLGLADDETGEPLVAPAENEWEWVTTPGTGQLRLAHCESWRAPYPGGRVNLSEVEAAILQAHAKFNFAVCGFDRSEMEYMEQRLRTIGLPMVEVKFRSGPHLEEMAAELVQRFRSRTVDLYDHPELIKDLLELKIGEPHGHVRLIAPSRVNAATATAGRRSR